MAHDVFISHSTKDKPVSDGVCASLERSGIRCWIAPRDVQPGRSFAGEINRAIQHSRVMVLIFSTHSNQSEQVLREVQLAVNSHLHIIQFRIEEVRLNDDLEYFLSTPHWLDALTPPLENHLERLCASIRALLDVPAAPSAMPALPPALQAPTDVARFTSASSLSQGLHGPAGPPQKQDMRTANKVPHSPVGRGRDLLLAGAILVFLTLGVLGGWWFGIERPRWEQEKREKQRIEEQRRLESEKKVSAEAEAEKQRLAAAQRASTEEAGKKTGSVESPVAATREMPYVNSLRMRFVPVPGTGVLFSVWETRVKDYRAFADATNRAWGKPYLQQTEEHPAVNVSWDDATAFCEWLTKEERKTGRLRADQSYRLPTDVEWSAAVGLKNESGSTPEERNLKAPDIYPWGTQWPPPNGAGNYASSLKVDDYKETSPVGSFAANGYGVHDLGGNVWEWCEDWFNAEKKYRMLRGASWCDFDPGPLLSSFRFFAPPETRNVFNGFRCVLVLKSAR